MLKKIILENFMSFRDRTEIPVAPLTIVLGPNSSGKSTISRALEVLRSVSENRATDHSAHVMSHRGNGEWVRIGIELTSWHWSREFDVGAMMDPDSSPEDPVHSVISTSDQVLFSFHPDCGHFDLAEIEVLEESGDSFRAYWQFDDEGFFWTCEDEGDFYFGEVGRNESGLVPPVDPEGLSFAESRLVSGPRRAVNLLERLIRVPAIRAAVAQVELLSSGVESDARDSSSITDPFQSSVTDSSGLVESVNRWFEILGIPYHYGIEDLVTARGPSREDREPRVVGSRHFLIDDRTGTEVWLDSVGTGIGQVIPVITTCASQPHQEPAWKRPTNTRILSIEQPELHLHPALQAELAELFVETVWRWEPSDFPRDDGDMDRIPNGTQLLIETHSEHLILRLQRMIRNGRLRPDDVSVLYVWMEDDTSLVRHIRLNELGEFIDEWPRGFFDERLDEILGD